MAGYIPFPHLAAKFTILLSLESFLTVSPSPLWAVDTASTSSFCPQFCVLSSCNDLKQQQHKFSQVALLLGALLHIKPEPLTVTRHGLARMCVPVPVYRRACPQEWSGDWQEGTTGHRCSVKFVWWWRVWKLKETTLRWGGRCLHHGQSSQSAPRGSSTSWE